ncbi:MAG: GNAT family N-acetyltransferase [Actinobacteria bacterium]|uniref:Unannotated protein n=1 Tax=freshwater metagenome TaxID=449393 RepID=A0A6J6LI02_9ZZZZ|nr:GNAT family N-acetyltransferase [Actinomycetota bacterium]MSW47037.1 GNAT family N-acetyltransferase [Actinomycetota bacterium]MSX25076.1 GNAT family N-acetyltransferase [Actinomycetota bacterium]MSY46332.1 GNAT family N-acetyltransferase [Actinomycetota bacterium]MSY56909.1 GNAT family N-acetyltransferase [Actinomycetota bacterium]
MKVLDFATGAYWRHANEEDRLDLYRVCVETGDSGQDATPLFNLPDMLGEVFVGPYLTFEPNYAFALINEGISGYLLATIDTANFESKLQDSWWPALQSKYAAIDNSLFTSEECGILKFINSPEVTDVEVTSQFPSQIHIDLLPRSQGAGYGKAMMKYTLELLAKNGSPGVHLHVSPTNERAFHFYQGLGFTLAHKFDDDWLMIRSL